MQKLQSSRRGGFTLVELLVVVTIISVLAAISLQVIGALLNSAKESKTRAALSRLQVLADHQDQRFDRLSKRRQIAQEGLPEARKIFPGATASAIKIVGLKLTYRNYMASLDTTEDDSAVMTDGWGHSIRMYLWPTRLFRSGGTGAALTPLDLERAQRVLGGQNPTTLLKSLTTDPDDPLNDCGALPGFEWLFHTPGTYHVVLFVSPGADGRLGLFEPDDTANFGNLAAVRSDEDLADDIFSVGRVMR